MAKQGQALGTSMSDEEFGRLNYKASEGNTAEELQVMVEESSDVAESFRQDGFVIIYDLFDVEVVQALHVECMSHYDELQELLKNKKLSLGIGIKHGFKEIVQRHLHRFEIPYKMDSQSINAAITGCKPLMDAVHAILGDDCHIVNKSLVLSLPGAVDQAWHVDGGHLSITEDLPCHCLNVFLPLVDVQHEDGPTELRLGSQWLTRDLKKQYMRAFLTKKLRGTQAPCLKRGSALLFDYRTLHRGLANTSSRPRPVLVYTFAKPTFKDMLNFPHYTIWGPTAAESEQEQEQKLAREDLPPPPPSEVNDK
jgi:ectoine hydroxylase-related dioxygenase (phytanoyl-CoA dioxygenase family)